MSEATLLPPHQLPQLPTPVPRVYGRPATQQPPPAPIPTAAHASPTAPHLGGPPIGTAPVSSPPPIGSAPIGTAPVGSPPTGSQQFGVPPPPAALASPAGPGYPQPATFGEPVRIPEDIDEGDRFVRPPEGGGSHTGMLIAVGIVVLAGVVGLVAFLWPRGDSAHFAINSCVRESQSTAVAVDCGAGGAYRIVAKVTSKENCPDPKQPWVELGSGKQRVLCLAPAGAANPPATLTPTAGLPSPGTT